MHLNTHHPLLSVLVITYNHGRFIRQCLEGIVMQKTSFPIEVIVGEDCSTDNTRSIVQEFEQRYPGIIKPVYHEKNVGGARNAYEYCYPLLKGKYIAFCEGDDYWTDPYKLQKQVDFLERHPTYVLCFHKKNIINQDDKFIKAATPLENPVFYTAKEIFHIHIPTLSAVFRNCIDQLPNEILVARGADAFIFGLLSRFGGAADLGFVGANYRLHNGGLFSTQTKLAQYHHAIQVRKLMKSSASFTHEQKIEINKELLRRKKLYAKVCLKKKDVVNCVKFLLS